MNKKKKAQREIGPVGKQNRIMIAMVVLSLCLIIVIGKLFSLQIVNSTGKYERQVDQLVEEVPIKASGGIYMIGIKMFWPKTPRPRRSM